MNDNPTLLALRGRSWRQHLDKSHHTNRKRYTYPRLKMNATSLLIAIGFKSSRSVIQSRRFKLLLESIPKPHFPGLEALASQQATKR